MEVVTVLLTVVFTLLGLSIGSFLNVCIDRLPAGRSLAYPPSRCDSCGHPLAVRDLVPLLSYLFLRGRCRYCGARIPRRVPLVEGLTAVLFLLAFWRFGLTVPFALTAFWCCVFLVIAFIDWEQKLILNWVTYPAAVVALVILAVASLPGVDLLGELEMEMWPSIPILSGLIGGAIGLAFFLIVFLINPRGMGMGDVKLAGLIGLAAGFPLGLVALFIGIFVGGLAAVALLVLRMKGRKDVVPYGTFLAVGPVVTLLWGTSILHWYLGVF
jgi:leader peptidase (prepilin peptidase)/N-methyltransferase